MTVCVLKGNDVDTRAAARRHSHARPQHSADRISAAASRGLRVDAEQHWPFSSRLSWGQCVIELYLAIVCRNASPRSCVGTRTGTVYRSRTHAGPML